MKNILLVGIGGFLGSIARYGIAYFFSKYSNFIFPIGTFIVNIIGSFLIGWIYGYNRGAGFLPYSLFFTAGFCGGFTTFSTFSLENFSLLEKGHYIAFFSYILLSILLGILFVFVGIMASKIK